VLRCSGRTAERLTEDAREAAREGAKAKRYVEIVRLKDQGKSNREVARETGTPSRTVDRVVAAPNPPMAEMAHPARPFLTEAAKANLRELESPLANAWASALRALRHVNEQVSIDEMYRLRFVGFDHVVAVELEKAYHWINELHGRFVNERGQRRRA
jgi:hypothetical protein